MQRKLLAAWLLLIVAALLSACGLPAKSEASLTVESYLQALVAKDDARLSTLSCATTIKSANSSITRMM